MKSDLEYLHGAVLAEHVRIMDTGTREQRLVMAAMINVVNKAVFDKARDYANEEAVSAMDEAPF